MNDEAVYRTAPATPGLLKIAWEEDIKHTVRQTDIATTRPNRPTGEKLPYEKLPYEKLRLR